MLEGACSEAGRGVEEGSAVGIVSKKPTEAFDVDQRINVVSPQDMALTSGADMNHPSSREGATKG